MYCEARIEKIYYKRMQYSAFSKHLIFSVMAVFAMTFLFALSSVSASLPTQPAPNGNPTFPPGAQGLQGPQGPQGTQGGTGPMGYTGSTGAQGPIGTASCNWNGSMWLSHGWDAGCAWYVGVRIGCSGGIVTSFQHYYYTAYGSCGYMCYSGGACWTPS